MFRYECGDYLSIYRRLEYIAVVLHLVTQYLGVHKRTVVRKRKRTHLRVYDERLSVRNVALACCRISYVSDAYIARKSLHDVIVKDFLYESHVLIVVYISEHV